MAAAAGLMGALGGAGGIGSILSAVMPLVGTLLGGGGKAPAPQGAPAAPPAAAAPLPPTVSGAPKAATEEKVLDTEAARVRSQKRRKAAADQDLLGLETDTDRALSLSRSLLGDE